MRGLVLHKINGSPPARAAMMIGDILGLKIQYKEVNILRAEHLSPEFIKKNPMHTIPLLEDGDLLLADSHAIASYLVNRYGSAEHKRLYPEDLIQRAKVDEKLYFDTGVLFQRFREITFGTFTGRLSGLTAEHIQGLEDSYEILERYLEKNKYLARNELSIADVCAGATVSSLDAVRQIDSEKYPKTHDWLNRMKRESFFEKMNAPGLADYKSTILKFWERNKKSKI
ncbi:Glutathione S-transferase 1 [Eumeta japonica]|uniref:Glutathione S-transferase 1 n=1 Tax=Eumeta variegata TaxID=151549 RepID=A0A4C1Z8Z0_EUMVA|nr:Glutathione S-transferase 1 [Eumeta japonica]